MSTKSIWKSNDNYSHDTEIRICLWARDKAWFKFAILITKNYPIIRLDSDLHHKQNCLTFFIIWQLLLLYSNSHPTKSVGLIVIISMYFSYCSVKVDRWALEKSCFTDFSTLPAKSIENNYGNIDTLQSS